MSKTNALSMFASMFLLLQIKEYNPTSLMHIVDYSQTAPYMTQHPNAKWHSESLPISCIC
jgi:hypothetical protein